MELVEVGLDLKDEQVLQLVGGIIEAVDSGETVFVIVDAFIGTHPGQFEPGEQWKAEFEELDKLLDRRNGAWESVDSLMSLRLAWKIWAQVERVSRILVTTNGVDVSPHTRVALADAYAEGRICYIYDWRVPVAECERLAATPSRVRALGGL